MNNNEMLRKIKKSETDIVELNEQLDNIAVHSDLKYIDVREFTCNDGLKVQGNGIHDDTAGIQKALDYAYENNLIVKFKQGIYLISKPLIMWASSSNYNSRLTAIIGDDRQTTKIYKPNSNVTDLKQHTFANACIIIANDKYKNGEISSNTEAGIGVECYNGFINGISLESNGKCDGIYSRGLFFFNFENIIFSNLLNAMVTQTWNCYNYFKKLDFNKCNTACEFGLTVIGGQSTMNFIDCHCNGVDVCCYNIRGTAFFYNCSIDGGLGTHYKIIGTNRGEIGWIGGRIVLHNCHSESPAIANDKFLIQIARGELIVYDTGFEVPHANFTNDSSMFELTNFSKLVLNNCKMNLRTGVTSTMGKMYTADDTSYIKLNDTPVDREMFQNYKPYNYNIGDYNSFINRQILDISSINKFISYIASGVSTSERPINTCVIENNRLSLKTRNSYNHITQNGFLFNKKIDLTNYSKINIQGLLNYLENEGTTNVNFKIGLRKNIIADGYVKEGNVESMDYTLTPKGDLPSNYNFEKANYMIDISNITGEYYICFLLSGINVTLEIKEAMLIR